MMRKKAKYKTIHIGDWPNPSMNKTMTSWAGVTQMNHLKMISRNNSCSLVRHLLFPRHSKILTPKKNMIARAITVNMVKRTPKLRTTWLTQTTRAAQQKLGVTLNQIHQIISNADKYPKKALIQKCWVERTRDEELKLLMKKWGRRLLWPGRNGHLKLCPLNRRMSIASWGKKNWKIYNTQVQKKKKHPLEAKSREESAIKNAEKSTSKSAPIQTEATVIKV